MNPIAYPSPASDVYAPAQCIIIGLMNQSHACQHFHLIQEESHLLANEMLPQLTADKTGTLEVCIC